MLIQPIIACQDFDLENLFPLLLTLSISAAHLRLQPDRFNPNLLSVGSVALFLLNTTLICPLWHFAAVFSQEQNRTQIARGNLK